MDIHPAGTRPTRVAPTAWFTGQVWQDPIVDAPEPARVHAVSVTFAPGARTHWHTHPLGQTLLVTTGHGLVQVWGEAIRSIRAGDTVWIAPGEKHWHGAAPDTAMTHIAIHEAVNGSYADWLEAVTDAQYGAVRAGA
ncbi:(R)-mandelonitrile lyase [Chthonobacter rhizosphaerae]|uniref:(R)-mandelonitrile lyase n=1 Tax=Chthonobacter rhizosphaerae TaxID=2735553 RepID=UPI0015EEBC0B|nr:cupin domain-containing protein [Chthonobacter rhizosphaerae]